LFYLSTIKYTSLPVVERIAAIIHRAKVRRVGHAGTRAAMRASSQDSISDSTHATRLPKETEAGKVPSAIKRYV
jgi:hypothetical protein